MVSARADARWTPPKPIAKLGRIFADNALALVVGGLLLILIGGPLALLVRMALSRPGTRPSNPEGITLANFERILESPATSSAVWNTAIYAIGVTIVSITLAALFAWLIERTDLPYRNLAWVIMLAPLALPKMLSSMAYILLLSPRTGIINVAIRDVLGFVGITMESGPFDIYSMPGMVFVEGVRGATALFLMLVGAFRLMDPALEEAAVMSGKGRFETLRRITLPLMMPVLIGAVIYAFVGNLQDFDTPLVLGLPAGIFVLPTLIYFTAYSSPVPNWGAAAGYASLFLVVMFILSAVYYRLVIKRSHRFTTISGKAFRPNRLQLGPWRRAAFGFFVLYGLVATIIPIVMLAWTSLLRVYQPPSTEAFGKLTVHNYAHMWDNNIFVAFKNSLVLSVMAALVTMAFAFIVSWAVIRIKVRGRALMDAMAFIPNVIPSVALGLALVMFFLSPAVRWVPIYGTLGLLVIAFAIHYLAYATRTTNGAFAQMSAELEEAGWVAGIGKLRTFFGVTLPVLFPTFIAGAVWVFAMTFKNLSLPLLLSTPKTRTVSIEIYLHWTDRGDEGAAAALGLTMIAILVVSAFLARRVVARGFSEE
jgi:iron(III) transport system permease protein